jgi:hypothetical protein
MPRRRSLIPVAESLIPQVDPDHWFGSLESDKADQPRRRRGRPPGTHQPRWARKFCELKTLLNEDGYESPVEGENARLSDYELRILVATWDYEEAHLVPWPYDPKVERRAAADRVLKAIKPLI